MNTECKMKLEEADKGMVDVVGATGVEFETEHRVYACHF